MHGPPAQRIAAAAPCGVVICAQAAATSAPLGGHPHLGGEHDTAADSPRQDQRIARPCARQGDRIALQQPRHGEAQRQFRPHRGVATDHLDAFRDEDLAARPPSPRPAKRPASAPPCGARITVAVAACGRAPIAQMSPIAWTAAARATSTGSSAKPRRWSVEITCRTPAHLQHRRILSRRPAEKAAQRACAQFRAAAAAGRGPRHLARHTGRGPARRQGGGHSWQGAEPAHEAPVESGPSSAKQGSGPRGSSPPFRPARPCRPATPA